MTDTTRVTSPIQHVTALKTGTVDLHVEHVEESRLPALFWILFGRERLENLPISFFAIEHDQGLILFDAGMSQAVTKDSHYWPDAITGAIMGRIFHFHIGPDDTLTKQLELAGLAAADVQKAVISHMHFDHVGCIAEIPQAELLCAEEAWEHMRSGHPEREGVLRRDIEVPIAKWKEVSFQPVEDDALKPFTQAHDLMGDGSIMLVPTPGHLEGSLSMFLRVEPPILFVGDLCYSPALMMRDQTPGTGEAETLLATWAQVRELKTRTPELLIVPSHDPAAIEQLSGHRLYRRVRGE